MEAPDPYSRLLELTDGKFAIVDSDLYKALSKFAWTTVKRKRSYYACTILDPDKSTKRIYMHRLIAHPIGREVTHHANRISLDNRRKNLINMLRRAHTLEHLNNPIKKVYLDYVAERTTLEPINT